MILKKENLLKLMVLVEIMSPMTHKGSLESIVQSQSYRVN